MSRVGEQAQIMIQVCVICVRMYVRACVFCVCVRVLFLYTYACVCVYMFMYIHITMYMHVMFACMHACMDMPYTNIHPTAFECL